MDTSVQGPFYQINRWKVWGQLCIHFGLWIKLTGIPLLAGSEKSFSILGSWLGTMMEIDSRCSKCELMKFTGARILTDPSQRFQNQRAQGLKMSPSLYKLQFYLSVSVKIAVEAVARSHNSDLTADR